MSTLLTMNFRINSGHTTGGEDMRLSVGKRVIPVFVVGHVYRADAAVY